MLRNVEGPLTSEIPTQAINFDRLLLLVQRNTQLNRSHAAVVAASTAISLTEEKIRSEQETNPVHALQSEKRRARNEAFLQFERKFFEICKDIIGFIDYLDTEHELIKDMPYWSLVCQYVVITENEEVISTAPEIEKLRAVAAQLMTKYHAALELYPAYRGGQELPAQAITAYIFELINRIETKIKAVINHTNKEFMTAALPELLMDEELQWRITKTVPLDDLLELGLTTESELIERGSWYSWYNEITYHIREAFFTKLEHRKRNAGVIDLRYPNAIDQFFLPLSSERFKHIGTLSYKSRYSESDDHGADNADAKHEKQVIFHVLTALSTYLTAACIAAMANRVELPGMIQTQNSTTPEYAQAFLYWSEYRDVIYTDVLSFISIIRRLNEPALVKAVQHHEWEFLKNQKQDLVLAEAVVKVQEHLAKINHLNGAVPGVSRLLREYDEALVCSTVPYYTAV